MKTKVQKSYEINNDTVVFHLDENQIEAKAEEVAEKLGEVIINDGEFQRLETYEVETQYAGTFEQSKWLEVPIDEVEEAVLNSTSMLIPEEKELIQFLLSKMDSTDEILYGSQIKGILRKLSINESVNS